MEGSLVRGAWESQGKELKSAISQTLLQFSSYLIAYFKVPGRILVSLNIFPRGSFYLPVIQLILIIIV